MNIPQADVQQLKEILEAANEILVVTSSQPTIDRLASCLAFYLALPQLGKRVTVACPDKVTVDVANLVGIDKVVASLGNKNFVISLPYTEGSIEKVSYNIEGDMFNLVIEPRPGFTFSSEKVEYSSNGSSAEVVLVIGAARLEDLGPFTSEIKKMNGATIVNIDIHSQNMKFGKLNFTYPGMGSVSEVATSLLSQLGLTLEVDNATNLLSGITSATENFTSIRTTPDSFETAALLLRGGAQNIMVHSPQMGEGRKDGFMKPLSSSFQPSPLRSQSRPPLPRFSSRPPMTSPPRSFPQRSFKSNEQPQEAVSSGGSDEEAPADWLQPKIFRSQNRNPNPPQNYTPSEGKGGLS